MIDIHDWYSSFFSKWYIYKNHFLKLILFLFTVAVWSCNCFWHIHFSWSRVNPSFVMKYIFQRSSYNERICGSRLENTTIKFSFLICRGSMQWLTNDVRRNCTYCQKGFVRGNRLKTHKRACKKNHEKKYNVPRYRKNPW